MTARCIGWEVSCDGDGTRECPHSAAVRPHFTSLTAGEVRADGREQGWWHGKHGGKLTDRCPDCSESAKQLRTQQAQSRTSRSGETVAAEEDPFGPYEYRLTDAGRDLARTIDTKETIMTTGSTAGREHSRKGFPHRVRVYGGRAVHAAQQLTISRSYETACDYCLNSEAENHWLSRDTEVTCQRCIKVLKRGAQ